MKYFIKIFLYFVLSFCVFAFQGNAKEKIIFDTDIGGDIDDTLALMQLLTYVKKGDANALRIVMSRDNLSTTQYLTCILGYYGIDIPFAKVPDKHPKSVKHSVYPKEMMAEKKPCGLYRYMRSADEKTKIEDSVKALRKILAQSEDNSISYVCTGLAINLSLLLHSQKDEISPLTGRELVAKKVKLISVMAGDFSGKSWAGKDKGWVEWNVRADVQSFIDLSKMADCKIVYSGYEVGLKLRFPQTELEKYFEKDSPVLDAYTRFAKIRSKKTGRHNRPLWDLTSLLYVIAPEYFELSEKGVISLDKAGVTYFTPKKDGKHHYLKIRKGEENKILERLIEDVCFIPKQKIDKNL